MRIGLGKRDHGGALLRAGAEKVFWHPEETDLAIEKAGIRAKDVVLVLRPSMLSARHYERILEACGNDVLFEVVGRDPVRLSGPKQIADFRGLKPKLADGDEVEPQTGRPAKIKHTIEQADAIIRLWHEVPRRKPADICRLADAILGLDEGTVKHHWVRDLVRKYVGTAQREKPKGWRGVRID